MVFTPEYATEVTLQPIRRFGFDAAILFSDILTIPEALGRSVTFGRDHGPQLEPLEHVSDLKRSEPVLEPVYEAVASIRSALAHEGYAQTALIGFAGAPWTIACYMVDGQGSKEFHLTRRMAYERPAEFSALIDEITDVTCTYLARQIEAGAEAVQIFDSWAGLLPEAEFGRWVIEPTRRIVDYLKARHPLVPIIGFPRQAGLFYPRYVRETGVTALGIDTQLPLEFAAKTLQTQCPVQGNLDPMALLAGGPALDDAVKAIKSAFAGRPYVFNLGHGVHKDTPPAHVGRVMELIRS